MRSTTQNPIEIKKLQKYLAYDPATGLLTWLVNRRPRTKAGDEAGTIDHTGRVMVGIEGKSYSATRLVWALMSERWPPTKVFAKDGNPQNLQWDNLTLKLRHRSNTYGAKYHRALRATNQRAVDVIRTDYSLTQLYLSDPAGQLKAMRLARAMVRRMDREGVRYAGAPEADE